MKYSLVRSYFIVFPLKSVPRVYLTRRMHRTKAVNTVVGYLDQREKNEKFLTASTFCLSGWTRDSVYCFKFFSNKHSWRRAEEVCRRYGSQLALVLNYHQNNFTRALATEGLKDQPQNAYWLGLKSVKDLATNTLESSSGYFIPKYVGHWSLDQPQPEKGQCVHAQVGERTQEWGLTSCETMLPFVCQVPACPSGKFSISSSNSLNSSNPVALKEASGCTDVCFRMKHCYSAAL